jgi:tRNA (guanine37-N1)-methyltransferase
MTGGELPAMIVVDSVVRLLPGVLNKQEGTEIESFSSQLSATGNQSGESKKLVEFPQYTRPEDFMGAKVPEILLSGHHAQIEKWRSEEALKRTKKNRSDLVK